MNISLSIVRDDRCRIIIKPGLLPKVGRILKKELGPRKVFVITDNTVRNLHYPALSKSLGNSGLLHEVISFPAGEGSKNLKTYERIIAQLLKHKADRKSMVVALGGGVTGDIAGLVSATYMRGLTLVQIPTTLVAQIDSSIGGKTAVDHKLGKNLIGAFYNPALTLIDPDLLSTLGKKDFSNGLFEVVKIALVSNRSLYSYIKKNLSKVENRDGAVMEQLIQRCAREKVNIVRNDPFDNGPRAVLNFGHTFGHSLETISDYRKISHGTAVGWGMLVAHQLSQTLEKFTLKDKTEVGKLIKQLLGFREIPQHDINHLWEIISHDKKASQGNIRFILLKEIGGPVFRSIDKKSFKIAVENICPRKS